MRAMKHLPFVILCLCAAVEGNAELALKEIRMAAKYNPNDSKIYNEWGTIYTDMKQYDKAIELYGKALLLDPKLAEAHEYIGEAYLEIGNIAEAKQHLTILQTLDPKLAEELRAEIARYNKKS